MTGSGFQVNSIHPGVFEITMKAPEKPTYKEDKNLKIIKFGDDNLYPKHLIDINSLSPQNNSCLLTCQKFIYGDGFVWSETPFAKSAQKYGINDKLLAKISYDQAFFETVSLRIQYDRGGKIIGVHHWDYSTVRYALPAAPGMPSDAAWISSDWEQAKKKEYKPFPVKLFNPKDAIKDFQEAVAEGCNPNEWFGQLLIWKKYKAGFPYYLQPRWANALDWVYVDGKTGVFQSSNVDNSFMPSAIMVHPIEPTGKTEDGRLKKQAIKEDIEKEFQGSENAGKIFHLYKVGSDGEIQVIQFEANTNSELFQTLKDLCDKQIGKAWHIPNALINVETPGKLGTSNEIAEATQFYQNMQIRPEQNHLLEMFNMLMRYMPNYDPATTLEISNSVPVTFIAPELLNDLSKGERRELLGYPAQAPGEDVGSETLLIERIGVGGSQALISLIQSIGAGDITPEQASNTLQILFGLGKEDADRIIYGNGGTNV